MRHNTRMQIPCRWKVLDYRACWNVSYTKLASLMTEYLIRTRNNSLWQIANSIHFATFRASIYIPFYSALVLYLPNSLTTTTTLNIVVCCWSKTATGLWFHLLNLIQIYRTWLHVSLTSIYSAFRNTTYIMYALANRCLLSDIYILCIS